MTQKMNAFLQQLLNNNKPIDIVVEDNAQIPTALQLEIAFESSFGENKIKNSQARRRRLSPQWSSSPPAKSGGSTTKKCDRRSRWSASESSSDTSSSQPPRLPTHMRSSTKKKAVDRVPPLPVAKASSSSSEESSSRQQSSERRRDTWNCGPLPIDTTQLVAKKKNNSREPRSSLEFIVEAIDISSLGILLPTTPHYQRLSPHDLLRQSRRWLLSVDAFQERSETP
jgi:hypothetical protein